MTEKLVHLNEKKFSYLLKNVQAALAIRGFDYSRTQKPQITRE